MKCRTGIGTLAMVGTVALATGQAMAESRAVVVANGDYRALPDVPDVRPDAALDAFKANGFRVVEGRDLASQHVRQAVGDLLRADAQPGPRVVVLIGRFVHSRAETWFLGSEAGTETLVSADLAGIPMSVVTDAMQGGKPHSILLLGTDQTAIATGAGLRHSLGEIGGVPGVTVIAGYSGAVVRAAERLARPGATVADALAQGQSLRIVSGKGADPVVAPNPTLVTPATDAAEAAAWQRAASVNLVAAYRDYLDRYPRGANAAEARRRIAAASAPRRLDDVVQPDAPEAAAWSQAKRTNSAAAYREFLQKYPGSLFAGAARGRMAELEEAANAPRQDPAAAAEAALNLSRAQRAQIQRQLTLLNHDTKGIDGAFGPDTRRAIQSFQRKGGVAPTGYLTAGQIELLGRSAKLKSDALEAEARKRQAAQDRADTAFWAENRGKGAAGARAYLGRFPDGLHGDAAREVLADAARQDVGGAGGAGDEAAWTRAASTNTAAAYREYLAKYPRGRHADDAQARVNRLQQQLSQDQAAEAALDLAPVVRATVQQRLNALGLKAGKADGTFDPQTRQALRRYQESRNLRPSGYLNQATVVRLLADTLLGQD